MFARNKIFIVTASQLNSELRGALRLKMRRKPNERLIVDSGKLSKQIKQFSFSKELVTSFQRNRLHKPPEQCLLGCASLPGSRYSGHAPSSFPQAPTNLCCLIPSLIHVFTLYACPL